MTPRARDASRAVATEQTRVRVVTSARELIGTRGIDATSLEDVASESGISRPGLLHHFRSKDALLSAVSVDFCAQTRRYDPAVALTRAGLLAIADYRSMAVQLLCTALTSESPTPISACHHDELLASARAGRFGSSAVTPRALVAAWEGLLVLQSYFPSIDPDRFMQERLAPSGLPMPNPKLKTTAVPLASLIPSEFGYAAGQSRRRQIVEDATVLFARNGYHRTTVRELASQVGISSSTLLHHFDHKAGLLAEVLSNRDEQLVRRRDARVIDPRTELGELGDEARRDLVAERGLIDVYAVLSTEAAHPDHPAHGYFAHRLSRTIVYFESLIVRAELDVVDPHLEAVWLVAVWDGLQFQQILNPDDVDLPAELDHYIETVLGIPAAVARSAQP